MTTPSLKSTDEKKKRRQETTRKYRDAHKEQLRAYQEKTRDAAKVRLERFWTKNPELKKTYWKEYGQKNREYIRSRNRLKWYGVTSEQWDALFILQGRKCAICGAEEPGGKLGWSGDHNHQTNKFRGILCRVCNVMLGHAKDDIATLTKAIEYLKNPPYRE